MPIRIQITDIHGVLCDITSSITIYKDFPRWKRTGVSHKGILTMGGPYTKCAALISLVDDFLGKTRTLRVDKGNGNVEQVDIILAGTKRPDGYYILEAQPTGEITYDRGSSSE